MFQCFVRAALLAGTACLVSPAAAAQPTTSAPADADPAVTPPPEAATAGSRQVYSAADFARFAPKTAYDMLVQVPGFIIRTAEAERGLGQASENVVVNGQRIANKSGGAIAELQRTPAANVESIAIVDAASIGIAGLSGQVANITLRAARKASGQFEWRPEMRPHYAHPNRFRGSASYNAKTGPFDYTISVNNQANRGAFGGPVDIRDESGFRFERRRQELTSDFDHPKFSLSSVIDGWGSSVGNVTLEYRPYRYRFKDTDRRVRTDGDDRTRVTKQRQNGYFFDTNADWTFAVGPGRLKLIGLRHFEHEPTLTTQVTSFDSGDPQEGVKFDRDVRIGETIGRAEYDWKGGPNSWQLSFERAYNSLAQVGRLFLLDPAGDYVEQDFPEGSGTVREVRYEGLATWSRALSPKLDLQLVLGAEHSTLERVDGDSAPRKFFRPKGSLTLGWRPSKPWDVSLKLNRKVGQISFYDFLSQPQLSDDRQNDGNPDLVPPQSWEAELEVGRALGAWGKTRLKGYYHRISDIVDFVPIGIDGQGVGNLPRAKEMGIESVSTLQFDPIGWRGAKLDLTFGFQRTQVRDPLTGEMRPISDSRDRWVEMELRHDLPGSAWAWGATANHEHGNRTWFLDEVGRGWEGPWFAGLYVENKNVMGLTVRLTAGNLLNARHRFERTVYTGRRNVSGVDYTQSNDQLIGPIFGLTVRGNL